VRPFHFASVSTRTDWLFFLFSSRLAMRCVRKVHTIGITQNMSLELHHFVMKDNKVLLVDFSRAVVHRCKNAMPVYSNQRFCLNRGEVHEDDGHECGELIAIAKESMHAASVPLHDEYSIIAYHSND
jgi:hypothetical protein